MSTPRKTTTKPDPEVLMPQPVEHKIGDRVFTQAPLTIRTMGGVLACMTVIFNRILDDPEVLAGFASIGGTDALDTTVGRAQLLQTAIKVIMSIPPELPAFLAAVLNVDTLEDAEYIGEHCRPVTLIKIVDTFVEQNEPQEMIEAFSALQTRLMGLELTKKLMEATSTES